MQALARVGGGTWGDRPGHGLHGWSYAQNTRRCEACTVVGICMDCVYMGLGSCVFVLGKSLGFIIAWGFRDERTETTKHVCPSSEIPALLQQTESFYILDSEKRCSQQSRP